MIHRMHRFYLYCLFWYRLFYYLKRSFRFTLNLASIEEHVKQLRCSSDRFVESFKYDSSTMKYSSVESLRAYNFLKSSSREYSSVESSQSIESCDLFLLYFVNRRRLIQKLSSSMIDIAFIILNHVQLIFCDLTLCSCIQCMKLMTFRFCQCSLDVWDSLFWVDSQW